MKKDHHFHIHQKESKIFKGVADLFLLKSREAVRDKNEFVVSLSGGSTPEMLFRRLAESPYDQHIPWEKIHVFWGDERCVPWDHKESNYGLARNLLLKHVPVPKENIYPIRGDLKPEAAANKYEEKLKDFFGKQPPIFDLVLLGLGEDGHTASLFPYSSILKKKKRWVKEVYVEDKKSYRISMTAPLINQARLIVFMVKGANKAQALNEVINGKFRPKKYPAQLIQPEEGEIHWYLDEEAAKKLPKSQRKS